MERRDVIEVLDVLACDIAARPKAPGIDSLAPYVRGASRDVGGLRVEFDAAAAALVQEFVEAERVCCSTLRWELADGDPVVLRIGASAEQIEALLRVFVRDADR
jgi:hypothetical protein